MADDALKGETIEQCDTGSELTTGDGTKAFSRDAKLECVASLYGQYPLWMIQQESKLASYGMLAKWGSNYPHLDPAFRRRLQTKDNTGALRLWLLRHKKNPYPSKPEKIMLAILSRMTMTQVSTWFANARRRLKKEFPESGAELYTSSTDISKDESSTDFCQTVSAGQQ